MRDTQTPNNQSATVRWETDENSINIFPFKDRPVILLLPFSRIVSFWQKAATSLLFTIYSIRNKIENNTKTTTLRISGYPDISLTASANRLSCVSADSVVITYDTQSFCVCVNETLGRSATILYKSQYVLSSIFCFALLSIYWQIQNKKKTKKKKNKIHMIVWKTFDAFKAQRIQQG